MPDGAPGLRFELDVASIRARSSAEPDARLAAAEARAAAAEQARREALAAWQAAEDARAQLTLELAEADAAKRALWTQNAALSNENDLLMKRISELVAQLSEATSRDLQLALGLEIQTLQRRLDERNRSLFGTSSERRPRPEAAEAPPKRRRRRKTSGGKRTEQVKLPVVEVPHVLPVEEVAGGCVACHGDLTPMKDQHESSEMINVQPVRYRLEVHRCQKYRCTQCGWITAAPGPDKLIPGGRYSPELAVQVAVDKYADALPLDRQVRRMARAGLEVTTQSLWDQLERMYVLLLPVYLVCHKRILEAEVLFADESPWRMMDNKGGSKRWWLWTLSDGAGVFFQLVSSRGAAAARALLHDFSGVLMSDDYVVYSALEKERTRKGGVQQVVDEEGRTVELWTPDYTLATCWMHARRYLHKAERYHPEAGPALDLIGTLYAIEEEIDTAVATRRTEAARPVAHDEAHRWLLDERRRRRDVDSRAILRKLDTWRKEQRVLSGSALDEALQHLERLWSRLVLFVDDPRLPLDNGHAERQIRGPVIGRKNYQGSRSEAGARVAALFFTLLGTARNLGLDLHEYLLAAVQHALKHPGSAWSPWDHAASLAAAAVSDPAP